MSNETALNPEVRIVGDTLVASLPDAVQPVVWRLPLGQVTAAAIEVRDAAGGHTLVLKGQDGQTQDIATYAAKAGAVRALTLMGQAMFGAPAVPQAYSMQAAPMQAAPMQAAPAPGFYQPLPVERRRIHWGWWFVVAMLVLVSYLLLHGPRRVTDVAPPVSGDAGGPAVATAPPAATATPGVPQSADSFLQQQSQ